ncbi:NADH:flavin oxidoreductase [Paenibacillus hamazuiensis]|uniref:NADH:flavin oxidoreductase n=1 Tax=Paenibacillus hamazuiensis TaxID=2936508 RepID=UPI00200F8257|nr:NADH:flavin oxidoreductase [Paenibacillus hamazuiensis]
MTLPVLSTFTLGRLELPNRVALSPMTRLSATPDGRATEEMARYYARFAAGGFGLIITESIYTDDTYSMGALNQPGLTNDAHVASWKIVTDAVHKHGGKVIAQLAHAGALSQGNARTDGTVAPSAYTPAGERSPLYGKGGAYPEAKALSVPDIKEIVGSFASAAERAKRAGFDGVEIHSANGFLPDQFLTDYTNRRTDEYGGSLENRLRFLLELIGAARAAAGPDFVIGVRISQAKVNHFEYKWPGGEADAKTIFGGIAKAGADYIHTYEYNSLAPAFGESGPTLAELAKSYGGVPVIVNGGLTTAEDAGNALAKGGDLVALGKIALSNHDWPKKAARGEPVKPFTGEVLAPTPTIKESELLSRDEL